GQTTSANFPTTPGAFDRTYNAGGDVTGFVTKLSAAGDSLVYSTYLGGQHIDEPRGIAVDRAGSAYVTGDTASVDFPTTPNAFSRTLRGAQDVFITKFNPSGSALVYSTLLGSTAAGVGTAIDHGNGIAVDASGAAYITGGAPAPDFPLTADAIASARGTGGDAFFTKLNAAGSA